LPDRPAPATMLINGKPGDTVSALDRGLQYGDGLFETLAVVGGEPALWERHMRRLESGCRRLGLPSPPHELLLSEWCAAIGAGQRGVLKILLTRGVGGRGYRPPSTAEPTRIIVFYPWPEYPQHWWRDGIRLRVCATRLGENPALAGLKHLSRLEQVLARAEWDDPGIAEGLMLNPSGHVVEGTMTNLFLLRDGTLITPDLSRCGVAGIMRGVVMDMARERGIPVTERTLALQELARADALFVTNSLIGIWPVRELDGRRFNLDAIPDGLGEAVTTVASRGMHPGIARQGHA
jgi:4-amino-4-deoxychorismate lyase